MREIKFRAWDTATKSWLNFDKYHEFTYNPDLAYNILRLSAGDQERLVWQQYTGLKDRHGKEVYQGDVLKIKADKEGYGSTSYGGVAEVTAQTCGFAISPLKPTLQELDEQWRKGGGGWDSSSFWHITDDDGKNIEVIGNIYESPELLK